MSLLRKSYVPWAHVTSCVQRSRPWGQHWTGQIVWPSTGGSTTQTQWLSTGGSTHQTRWLSTGGGTTQTEQFLTGGSTYQTRWLSTGGSTSQTQFLSTGVSTNQGHPSTSAAENHDNISSATVQSAAQTELPNSSQVTGITSVSPTPSKEKLPSLRDGRLPLKTVRIGDHLLPSTSNSLAAYVSVSHTLTALVLMGVDLSVIDRDLVAANHLVKLDLERDIRPYILFLGRLGLRDLELAKVFTRCPRIFIESLDDLEVRVNYLESKGFTVADMSQIIHRSPALLLKPTKETDAQLCYLQKNFRLKGFQVRDVVNKLPQLAVSDKESIRWTRFAMKEFLEFTEEEMTEILLVSPRIYLENRDVLMDRFDYLHNEMGLSYGQLLAWPEILLTRKVILQERYQFLKLLGRVQFDSTAPNFVSLKSLVSGTDAEYCSDVAKVSEEDFDNFLRTL